MKLCSEAIIRERIKVATEQSPIAVFFVRKFGKKECPLFHAVFADTVMTRMRIASKDPLLIGVYSRETRRENLHNDLEMAMKFPPV